ncbi:MAG: hypothetical protein GXN96_01420 [Aquificae bacterium]|nr:hypothetical protein [Aquificota bacterium]
MKFWGLELHAVLTENSPSKELLIAELPDTKRLRIETLEIFTDVSSASIGGVPYSKYPYTIHVKENGITIASLLPDDDGRTLSRFKVDFAFPVEVQGRITALVSTLSPLLPGDAFSIHVQIVAVELSRDETISTWRK